MTSGAVGRPYAQIAATATLIVALAGSAACDNVDTDDTNQEDTATDTNAPTDTGVDTETEGIDTGQDTLSDCKLEESNEIRNTIAKDTDCLNDQSYATTRVFVDTDGKASQIELCMGDPDMNEAQQETLLQCYLDLLEGETFSCLNGEQATHCPLVIE